MLHVFGELAIVTDRLAKLVPALVIKLLVLPLAALTLFQFATGTTPAVSVGARFAPGFGPVPGSVKLMLTFGRAWAATGAAHTATAEAMARKARVIMASPSLN